MLREILESMRPRQWYKNLLIFLAIFFSRNLLNPAMLGTVALGFIVLCLVSSASYVINDIVDAGADRHHDKKKSRPIASGRLGIHAGIAFALILYAAGLFISWGLGAAFTISIALLIAMSQLYTFFFRSIAFADILVLSINFVLRAIAGALAIGVSVSPWLLIGVYLLALFLSTAKRKADLEIIGKDAQMYRSVFKVYSPELLGDMMLMESALLVMSYCLYSFLGFPYNSIVIMLTIPVVLFLVFRYHYLTMRLDNAVRDPELALLDPGMLAGISLWALMSFIALYIA